MSAGLEFAAQGQQGGCSPCAAAGRARAQFYEMGPWMMAPPFAFGQSLPCPPWQGAPGGGAYVGIPVTEVQGLAAGQGMWVYTGAAGGFDPCTVCGPYHIYSAGPATNLTYSGTPTVVPYGQPILMPTVNPPCENPEPNCSSGVIVGANTPVWVSNGTVPPPAAPAGCNVSGTSGGMGSSGMLLLAAAAAGGILLFAMSGGNEGGRRARRT